VSDAEVAEVSYTAFTSTKGQAITARLVVRRVRDLNRQAAAGQGARGADRYPAPSGSGEQLVEFRKPRPGQCLLGPSS
jgi:hypothetical protein